MADPVNGQPLHRQQSRLNDGLDVAQHTADQRTAIDFVVDHIRPEDLQRFVAEQEIQSNRVAQRGEEILHGERLQIDATNLLSIAEYHVRWVGIVAAARELIVGERVAVAAFAFVMFAILFAHLRARAPVLACMLIAAAHAIGLEEHVRRTRAHKSLG